MARTDEITVTPGAMTGTSAEITGTPAGATAADTQAGLATPGTEKPEELLIEEISIDGMCGVY